MKGNLCYQELPTSHDCVINSYQPLMTVLPTVSYQPLMAVLPTDSYQPLMTVLSTVSYQPLMDALPTIGVTVYHF